MQELAALTLDLLGLRKRILRAPNGLLHYWPGSPRTWAFPCR